MPLAPILTGRRRWIWLLAAVLLALVTERGLRWRTAGRPGPVPGAAWIWVATDPHAAGASAFYAVREIELAAPPASARLAVLADEEYLLFLNGERVGSNRYRAGAPMDVYEVAPLLRPGGNRLVVELRSRRGAGGLLLHLADGDGRTLVASDRRWEAHRAWRPWLLAGELRPAVGEPVVVWGRPPTGRWGTPRPGPPRPLFATVAPDGPREPPRWRRRRQVAGIEGPWQLYDWGEEVTGYLQVRFAGSAPPVALLFAGDRPPAREEVTADGYLLTAARSPAWGDAEVRRFRYVAVVGRGRIRRIRVWPVRDGAGVELASTRPQRGVFGLEPVAGELQIERAIRRRLDGEPEP